MRKLTENDIKLIIKRASIIQKYHDQTAGRFPDLADHEDDTLYEIGASLGLDPHHIREALIEFQGIPTEDPIMVDTGSNYLVEIQANANGTLDSSLVSELLAHVEYHFNSVGSVSRRKGNVYWNAKPSFPSKLFETSSSPQIEFGQRNGQVKLKVTQSLKTLNKLYLPAIAASLGGLIMLGAIMFDRAGNDEAPFVVISTLFFASSFLYARFIKNRKLKRKKKLIELTETLQQIIERRFRTGRKQAESTPEISLEELDELNENEEISVSLRDKVK